MSESDGTKEEWRECALRLRRQLDEQFPFMRKVFLLGIAIGVAIGFIGRGFWHIYLPC